MTPADVRRLEHKLDVLLARNLAGPVRPDVLHGWAAISAYMGLPARRLRDWRRERGFPVINVGRRRGTGVAVMTTCTAINSWVLANVKAATHAEENGHADAVRVDGAVVRADYRPHRERPLIVRNDSISQSELHDSVAESYDRLVRAADMLRKPSI